MNHGYCGTDLRASTICPLRYSVTYSPERGRRVWAHGTRCRNQRPNGARTTVTINAQPMVMKMAESHQPTNTNQMMRSGQPGSFDWTMIGEPDGAEEGLCDMVLDLGM